MRWVFRALVLLSLASPAAAADFDVLRGPEPVAPPPLTVGPATFTRWSGFYAGGQFGLSNANANFGPATDPGIAFALRNTLLEFDAMPSQWQVLGNANNSTASYGGFIGYNSQWQDLVIGVEANYNFAPFSLHAPASPIARTTWDSAGNAYSLDLTGSGSLSADNFGTLRLRAGWVAGSFLPYGFAGFAMAVGSSAVSVSGSGLEYSSGTVGVCPSTSGVVCPIKFSITNSFSLNTAILYGFTVGAGVDVAMTHNIFLRAEFEFDQFNPPPGYLATVMTGRVGGGIKF